MVAASTLCIGYGWASHDAPSGAGGIGAGGGLYTAAGTLNVSSVIVQANQALGGTGGATNAPQDRGSGDGYLEVPGNGGVAYGGGIDVAGGTGALAGTELLSNVAQGGDGGPGMAGEEYSANGGNAFGGGLYAGGGTLVLTSDTVTGNEAAGGPLYGYFDGYIYDVSGYGGGIGIASLASVSLDSFTVTNTTNNFGSVGPNIDGNYNTALVPPPVITHAASANQNPVTGVQTQLQVQASDPQGANLSYAWSVASQPNGAKTPTFNNANNNNTNVTFYQAGSYTFTVTVTDALGLSSTSSVTVTVVQTLPASASRPANVTLAMGATQQFTATALDQFGQAMASQPAFTWQVGGGQGTISSTGLYTAPASGTGNFQVKVSAGGKNAQANVTVTTISGSAVQPDRPGQSAKRQPRSSSSGTTRRTTPRPGSTSSVPRTAAIPGP